MKYKNNARDEQLENELDELLKAQNPEPDTEENKEAPVVSPEEKTWEKRYGDLKSYADKQRNELTQKITELEKSVSLLQEKPKGLTGDATEEEIQEWLDKFPDLGRIMIGLSKKANSFEREEIVAKVEKLEEVRTKLAKAEAFQIILEAHPDFNKVVTSQNFKDWIELQPEEKGRAGQIMYDAMYSGDDPDEAIKVMNIYKKELALSRPKADPAKTAAPVGRPSGSTPPVDTSGKRTWRETEIERMSMRDYEKYEDDIDAAKREGRFVYDLSGAAA